MHTLLLVSVGSTKAVIPFILALFKGAVGAGAKKHAVGKAAKEVVKEQAKDMVSDAIKKKDDDKPVTTPQG